MVAGVVKKSTKGLSSYIYKPQRDAFRLQNLLHRRQLGEYNGQRPGVRSSDMITHETTGKSSCLCKGGTIYDSSRPIP